MQSYNILIVEDEWVNAMFIQDILESLGHNVLTTVPSADTALKTITKYSVDFIFMDINIQGSIDGIQLAQMINYKDKIPIIFMTAFGDSDTMEEASHSNIYGFIIKPFTESDVESVLNIAIAKLQKENEEQLKLEVQAKKELILSHNYIYNFDKKLLYFSENIVKFSKNEAKLMHLFCLNHGDMVSFEMLYGCAWEDKQISNSTLRDTIVRIRKKVPQLNIENITAVGYKLQKDNNG